MSDDSDIDRVVRAVEAMTKAASEGSIPPNDLKVLLEIREQWSDVKKDLDTIKTTTSKVEVLLTGNGDPSKGLLQRFALVQADVEAHKKLLWLIGSGTVLAMIKLIIDLLMLLANP